MIVCIKNEESQVSCEAYKAILWPATSIKAKLFGSHRLPVEGTLISASERERKKNFSCFVKQPAKGLFGPRV